MIKQKMVVHNQVWDQVRKKIGDSVTRPISAQVNAQFNDQVIAQINKLIGNEFEKREWIRVMDQVWKMSVIKFSL